MAQRTLRTSLIWHDEVMADLVHDAGAAVTIGATDGVTHVTPPLDLPPSFAIVRPGERGHVLTLGPGMGGTICIDGVEQNVRTLLAEGAHGFHAASIRPGDWGIVELDGTGTCKLFFQFVPVETPVLWASPLGWLFGSRPESQASLAFSVLLHAAIVLLTVQVYAAETGPLELSSRSATGRYLATRLTQPTPRFDAPVADFVIAALPGAERTVIPTIPSRPPTVPAQAPVWKPIAKPRSSSGEIASAGRPDRPRAVEPLVPRGTVLDHADVLDQIGRGPTGAIGKLGTLGPTGGRGGGGNEVRTTRGGRGDGPAGGDGAGPLGPRGPLDTGGERAAVCVGAGCGGGNHGVVVAPPAEPTQDGPEMTKDAIDREIQRRKSMFRTCYQRELNRAGVIDGDIQVKFEIAAGGNVSSARVVGGSLTNADVRSCVIGVLTKIRFPPSGGAIVSYPFMFSTGS